RRVERVGGGPGGRARRGGVVLDNVELVAQPLPTAELLGIGRPVPLEDRPQRVRAVADRLRRLGAETVDPHVAYGAGGVARSGGVHSPRSIRAGHGHTTRNARTSPAASSAVPAVATGGRATSRKHVPSSPWNDAGFEPSMTTTVVAPKCRARSATDEGGS